MSNKSPRHLELISFALCPFVQRAVIALKNKATEFKITYIDLSSPPDWFLKISPLGQVPVLRVGDDVIFESAVICELIDELFPPSLHPKDPIKKAKERAWMEYGSAVLREQYALTSETDPAAVPELLKQLFEALHPVEEQLGSGPYFRGSEFGFVDLAFAPGFMRMQPLGAIWNDSRFQKLPKTRKWAEALLQRTDVQQSVLPEFRDDYLKMLQRMKSAILKY